MAHNRSNIPHLRVDVQLGDRGRLVLPASVRKRLGWHTGDRLVLVVQDSGEVRLVSLRHQVQACAGMFKPSAAKTLASDELIAERRAEAAREEQR